MGFNVELGGAQFTGHENGVSDCKLEGQQRGGKVILKMGKAIFVNRPGIKVDFPKSNPGSRIQIPERWINLTELVNT